MFFCIDNIQILKSLDLNKSKKVFLLRPSGGGGGYMYVSVTDKQQLQQYIFWLTVGTEDLVMLTFYMVTIFTASADLVFRKVLIRNC
jgi:hypothetical protein